MFEISDADIMYQHDLVVDAFKHNKVGMFTEESFIKKAFPVLEQRANRTYPYTVRIPKSIPEMIQGDFSPAQEVVVEKPIEGPYGHMWFGDSVDGIQLLCGYKNGDSRYINDVFLGDKDVHAVMAGATGQGKSVTLNSIIYGACLLYAPWELHLTLSDAKIVEFKSIATNHPMPHIEIVAATGDTDYLMSVLETKYEEMNRLNSVFNKAAEVYGREVKKLEDFRKVTGLMLPQNLLIFDEFQAMFKSAAKKASKIADLIDLIARKGRNAGYHLMLTSQELGSDIPTATLSNITVRAAMGCFPAVSEMILGNDAASANLGKKGKLIFNLNSTQKKKEDNFNVTVPFISFEANEISHSCIEHGKEFDVIPTLRFYDEEAVIYEQDYPQFLLQFKATWHKLYLGPPSFITDDPDQCLKIEQNCKDRENICVLSSIVRNQIRLFKMLMFNVLRCKDVTSLVMCANADFEDAGARQLSDQFFFNESDYEHSQTMDIARQLIYRRRLAILADTGVFRDQKTSETSDKLFYSLFDHGSPEDTLLYRSRCYYVWNYLLQDPIISTGLSIPKDKVAYTVKVTLQMYAAYGASQTKLELDSLPPVFIWVLGAERILGLGRDTKTKFVESFKKLLQDSNSANMRFVMAVSTFDEFSSLKEAFKYYVMDNILQRDITKVGLGDDYPESISKVLAVMYDKDNPNDGCLKFKKMFFSDELP